MTGMIRPIPIESIIVVMSMNRSGNRMGEQYAKGAGLGSMDRYASVIQFAGLSAPLPPRGLGEAPCLGRGLAKLMNRVENGGQIQLRM